jgi:putative tricarboxylic transport membrane protein
VQSDQQDEPSLVKNRTMEIVVALILLAGSAVVIFDSTRIGFGWKEGEGPAPGYFPFYVAVVLAISSLVNLAQALRGKAEGGDESFVSKPAFRRVLAVLVPTLVYVTLIGGVGPVPGLGIYVASALFILGFMLMLGGNGILTTLLVSIGVPIALFFMFEKWFLVPLPKGPLEAMLGLG